MHKETHLILKHLFISILIEKQRDRDLLSTGSLLKCPQQPKLRQSGARSLEFNLSFPCGWQETQALESLLLSPRLYVIRKLGPKQTQDSNPDTPKQDEDVLRGDLTAVPYTAASTLSRGDI